MILEYMFCKIWWSLISIFYLSVAEYSESFVYMLDVETILATTLKRYNRNFKNLIKKIDCSEIFIEAQKKTGMAKCVLV